MSTNFIELKNRLYEVYKHHKNLGALPAKFRQGLDQYYANPNPESFVNRLRLYVDAFDRGEGDETFRDFITDVKEVLELDTGTVNSSEKSKSSMNEVRDSTSKSLANLESNEGATHSVPESKTDDIKPSVPKDKVDSSISKPKPNVSSINTKLVGVSDTMTLDVENLAKPKPQKPSNNSRSGSSSSTKKKRKGKVEILDRTDKTLKVALPNGLVELLDQNIFEFSKSHLISSGLLTDQEALVLSEGIISPTSIFKKYDFNLTRSDLFIILALLGLTHFNVNLTDSTIESLFGDNTIKLDFYNSIVNTNLVELDVQSRVKELERKLDKNVSVNEKIETMLGFLLLERANAPKNENRETIKKALDTSSVMNQSVDAFGLLDGLIGSKVSSIKDYKRARGE